MCRGNFAIHPNQSIRATIGFGGNNRKKGQTKTSDKTTRRVNKTTHRACSHERRLEERETTVMNKPCGTPAPRAIQYSSCKAKLTWNKKKPIFASMLWGPLLGSNWIECDHEEKMNVEVAQATFDPCVPYVACSIEEEG